MIQNSIAIEGKRFGKLTVIKEVDSVPRKCRMYLCHCSCGGTAILRRSRLLAGRVKSCGCMRGGRSAIKAGERSGRLVILREGERKYNHRTVVCLCDCGNETTVLYSNFKRGNSKSCGCIRREYLDKIGSVKGGIKARKRVAMRYKGELLTDYARAHGLKLHTIYYRVRHGMSIEEAVEKPVRHLTRKEAQA